MLYFILDITIEKGFPVQNKLRFYTCLSAVSLLTCSCTTTSANHTSDESTLEQVNRAVFTFNSKFDKYLMHPVAEGYRNITTPYVRERVSNALSNVKEPVFALNHLLQGSPVKSGASIARFAINSTLGLAGTYDVAAQGWNLPKEKTGFDETLAVWNVPDGPFIMLPFFGPSTPRAAVGLLADSAANPVYWATQNDANIRDKIYLPYVAVNATALRESTMDLTDDFERNSVDYYTTMKSAYMQNRTGSDTDGAASYDFGMEDEDEIFDEME